MLHQTLKEVSIGFVQFSKNKRFIKSKAYNDNENKTRKFITPVNINQNKYVKF